ncbi:MAG: galactokinase [Burkholderiales bacterium]|nr:galactokinase [Burkholderiales bacterium]MDQ3195908.1 galactokinase [Pseudomonadota bacterium]
MSKTFEQLFGFAPEVSASAPGRVNLLGEHTDYNDGYVLPIAIPQRTTVQLARSRDARSQLYSSNLDESARFDGAPAGYARYVIGCVRALEQTGVSIPPFVLRVASDVPIGAGLSSSAALEVAVLRAMREWLGLELEDVAIAQLAQRAEIEFAHVRCGIMDQMAASLADTSHMLFLDTRTLTRRLLALPPDAELVVIDSGIPRSLAASAYNQRRAECEQAAQRLGVPALRDVDELSRVDTLPAPLDRRARHVVSENQRVLDAVGNVTAQRFGELMNASHTSLRDDYEVSVPALDALVALLQDHPNVFGARLTGAGFGGACVALVEAGYGDRISAQVLRSYNADGHHGRAMVVGPRVANP